MGLRYDYFLQRIRDRLCSAVGVYMSPMDEIRYVWSKENYWIAWVVKEEKYIAFSRCWKGFTALGPVPTEVVWRICELDPDNARWPHEP